MAAVYVTDHEIPFTKFPDPGLKENEVNPIKISDLFGTYIEDNVTVPVLIYTKYQSIASYC